MVAEEHGLTEGRVMETVEPPVDYYGGTWVMGDANEKVKLLNRRDRIEFEIVD